MSGDEALVLLVSVLLGPLAWGLWFWRLSGLDRTGRRRPVMERLLAVLAACAAGLLAVLLTLAAHDVRDSFAYICLYLLLGSAWLRMSERCLPWFGLSVRDDLVERGNDVVLPALAGFLGAMTLAYAGANIGDGPGWWVVVVCAGLASLAVLLAWAALECFASVAEQVTVERDRAAGWRLGGFLLACGAIAGRAVAGDWISADATLRDFVFRAWPLLMLLVAALLVEFAARPRPDRLRTSFAGLGALPACAYLALAASAIAAEGWPA